MILTSGNDRKAHEKSPFAAGKPHKSMGNGTTTPSRKISELCRRIPAVSRQKEQLFGGKTMEKSENFPFPNVASVKPSEFHGTDRFLAVLSDL